MEPVNDIFAMNYGILMLCRPLLADNWQAWMPHLRKLQLKSVINLIDSRKIESVEYREIKKIIESDTISESDRKEIKKQRRLANNRRAARRFRERACETLSTESRSVESLKREKNSLLKEKELLLRETNYYRQYLLHTFEAEY